MNGHLHHNPDPYALENIPKNLGRIIRYLKGLEAHMNADAKRKQQLLALAKSYGAEIDSLRQQNTNLQQQVAAANTPDADEQAVDGEIDQVLAQVNGGATPPATDPANVSIDVAPNQP